MYICFCYCNIVVLNCYKFVKYLDFIMKYFRILINICVSICKRLKNMFKIIRKISKYFENYMYS